MDYVMAFIFGGFICVIGQILMDATKLTPVCFNYICDFRGYIKWFGSLSTFRRFCKSRCNYTTYRFWS